VNISSETVTSLSRKSGQKSEWNSDWCHQWQFANTTDPSCLQSNGAIQYRLKTVWFSSSCKSSHECYRAGRELLFIVSGENRFFTFCETWASVVKKFLIVWEMKNNERTSSMM
jgi:hypothetical protein